MNGWSTIRGRLAFGHLVVVPGRILNVRLNVIIDTGSDASLANVALRQALRAHVTYDRDRLNQARAYTAGLPIVLDSVIATPRLRLGDLEVDHVVVGGDHRPRVGLAEGLGPDEVDLAPADRSHENPGADVGEFHETVVGQDLGLVVEALRELARRHLSPHRVRRAVPVELRVLAVKRDGEEGLAEIDPDDRGSPS